MGTLRDLRETLQDRLSHVELCIDEHLHRDETGCRVIEIANDLIELMIFDEAERLSVTALEFIRDIFDRRGVGVILIGMPEWKNGSPDTRSFTAVWVSLITHHQGHVGDHK